jgi:hypothetical protein
MVARGKEAMARIVDDHPTKDEWPEEGTPTSRRSAKAERNTSTRSLLAAALGACLVVSGCGAASIGPAEAETCGQLVDVAIAVVDDALRVDAAYYAVLDQLKGDLATVSSRSDALACSSASTSESYRRALIETDHSSMAKSRLIVNAAIYDPFRAD